MTEIQQTNSTDIAEDENNRVRPADIEAVYLTDYFSFVNLCN